jgi:hypothetical protein
MGAAAGYGYVEVPIAVLDQTKTVVDTGAGDVLAKFKAPPDGQIFRIDRISFATSDFSPAFWVLFLQANGTQPDTFGNNRSAKGPSPAGSFEFPRPLFVATGIPVTVQGFGFTVGQSITVSLGGLICSTITAPFDPKTVRLGATVIGGEQ